MQLIFQDIIQPVKKIVLLVIPNEKGLHYLSATILSELRGITSKYYSDFYCLNCLHSFAIESKPKSHEIICENKDFCGIVLPTQMNNILELNQCMKSDKMAYII